MEKNVEFLSFETVSILLATFPNSDGEFENILKKNSLMTI
ncbi:hypothetical protein SULAZ_1283 [Sulfurihydrogenibium azorense Az-Fu1]|uniref:Uncharacterized protein n=1 Tax=Sulfurihydrogenibium azorense (strain DSM 15241 / OCM 825 / Az-Fu1) TaxID=204536 RepID=C1DVW5_SULAA|nr:hypothetical protein SULAZ_1283 [Sulfurihydrogenibium azorense Az-Fu1]